MGEKIKSLNSFLHRGTKFEIELNHPPSTGANQQIHIQSENLRFELDKNDFVRFGISILLAAKNLKNIKEIE